MNDIFKFVDELHNLKALYKEGELCELDFNELIDQYEDIIQEFEKDLDDQYRAFQNQMDVESYDPVGEY